MTADEWVWLARIRRPQGRKGEVFAEILTDFPEKFSARRRLFLLPRDGAESRAGVNRQSDSSAAPRELTLANHWLHKGGVVLHFAGIHSISDAENLTGQIVAIPREERASLGENGAYISDLIGCTIVDVSGAAPIDVGEIEDIDRSSGPVALLVVRGTAGEILIPFAKSYLRKIDLETRCVNMALPEGLVDLNAPDQKDRE
jgi:16S rRNA processing protein RimM